MNSFIPLSQKILPASALSELFEKASPKVRVFTNGCFDLLHVGHVEYLEEASQLGQELIVALNSDASVKKLKGPSRPVNPLSSRLKVIAALQSVRWVTWFEEETPLSIILKLNPAVLVKGGDWAPEKIIGSKEVLAQGGKVLSIPYRPGHSTTEMIQKIERLG